MILSGEKNAPKMQVIFTDTVKIDVKLERNGKDIAFSMIPFPSNENKKYFFTGTIDPVSHSLARHREVPKRL
jgi:hypothetical protein